MSGGIGRDSGACRSVIPFHADHPFRCMAISDSAMAMSRGWVRVLTIRSIEERCQPDEHPPGFFDCVLSSARETVGSKTGRSRPRRQRPALHGVTREEWGSPISRRRCGGWDQARVGR